MSMTKTIAPDLFADQVNQMLAEASNPDPEKLPRDIYPIYALPLAGGDYSLAAEAIEHRSRAVKIFNGVTEVWLPRSQIRRIIKNQVIVSEWIVQRKREYFMLLKNQSPEYASMAREASQREGGCRTMVA